MDDDQVMPTEAEASSVDKDIPKKKISVDSGISSEKADAADSSFGDFDEIDGPCSKEMLIMQSYFHKLMLAMVPEVFDLSSRLYSAHMIRQETRDEVLSSDKPAHRKCAVVLKDIEYRVMVESEFLVKFITFLEQETTDPLQGIATEMKRRLEFNQPPQHSLSENFPRKLEAKLCLKTAASSPAAFAPQLSSMCEHCELQHHALFTMFEKFCQDYLKTNLGFNHTIGTEDDFPSGDPTYDPEPQAEQYSFGTSSFIHTQPAVIPPSSLESSSTVGPPSLELSPSLFRSSPSRQCSTNSCYSANGGEEYITTVTADFLEKLKSYYQQQKESKKRIILEKKVMTEKLIRTEEEFKELTAQQNDSEKELQEARDEVSILRQALSTAQARISQLNSDIIRYKTQLMAEKCTNGNSIDCKHFVRASALEEKNKALEKQKERLESDNSTYQLKIDDLELREAEILRMLVNSSS